MKESKGLLQIADLSFPIEGTSLTAKMSDPYWCDTYNHGKDKELIWILEVVAGCKEIEDDFWSPKVYVDSFQFPSRNWPDLCGQEFKWDSPFDDQSGYPNGGFYVWQHADISRASLRFVDRDALDFRIEWDGLCDIHWGDKYGTDVEFSLCTTATFSTVYVAGSEHDTKESLRTRLGEYLDPSDFEQSELEVAQHTYSNGVGMTSCKFWPKGNVDWKGIS